MDLSLRWLGNTKLADNRYGNSKLPLSTHDILEVSAAAAQTVVLVYGTEVPAGTPGFEGAVMRAIIYSNLSISRTHTREPETEVVYASRYPHLGLTGYGSSEEEADDTLKNLLDVFTNCLLEKGLLIQRLERLQRQMVSPGLRLVVGYYGFNERGSWGDINVRDQCRRVGTNVYGIRFHPDA